LQMGLEQRIIPRPQRRQETIASMLVLIWIHVGLTPPSARHSTPFASSGHQPIPEHVTNPKFLGRRWETNIGLWRTIFYRNRSLKPIRPSQA
jgi:hypothetical protein